MKWKAITTKIISKQKQSLIEYLVPFFGGDLMIPCWAPPFSIYYGRDWLFVLNYDFVVVLRFTMTSVLLSRELEFLLIWPFKLPLIHSHWFESRSVAFHAKSMAREFVEDCESKLGKTQWMHTLIHRIQADIPICISITEITCDLCSVNPLEMEINCTNKSSFIVKLQQLTNSIPNQIHTNVIKNRFPIGSSHWLAINCISLGAAHVIQSKNTASDSI